MMPAITGIKPQKNKNRFNVFLDGKYLFSLDSEALIKEKLKVGQQITPEKIQELIRENELQTNLDRAFNFLSYRPRSRKEILDFLRKKDLGEKTQQLIIQKLEDLKMIDDLKFCQWWLEQRETFQPKGKRLLVLELKRKGIPQETINQALTDQGEENELELAQKLLEKKKRQLAGLSGWDLKKKASELLLRRGFSWETVSRTVANYCRKE